MIAGKEWTIEEKKRMKGKLGMFSELQTPNVLFFSLKDTLGFCRMVILENQGMKREGLKRRKK